MIAKNNFKKINIYIYFLKNTKENSAFETKGRKKKFLHY